MSLVSSSVSAAASVATYNINTSHTKNETSSEAINIGNLDQESATVDISDQGTVAGQAVSTTFTAQAGVATLSSSFENGVDAITTDFQLYDGQGNIIADSQGTTDQQAAYEEWAAGSLQISAGTYTAIATPLASSSGSPALTISKSEQQGTSLQVSSQLTGSDSTEYYDFSLSGSNIKLDFNASSNGSAARVILYNSAGAVVADSDGNAFEKANYAALTSGTGISATSGDYSAEVTYAPNVDPTTENINYSLNLYSGNSYAVVYNNKVAAQPTDTTAAGSVTADSDAQLYTRSAYNTIKEQASAAVNIGWLQQDKSSLDVYSQLTSADSADYYSFTLQQGNNLKFGFVAKNTTDASDLRVQILDSSGSSVIADNEGTRAQQAAYKALTTTNGLTAKAGGYLVKISYAPNATKKNSTYEFGIYSGTTYAAQYKTTVSPQTYANALLSGTLSGSSSSSAIAAYLTAVNNDDTDSSLNDALKLTV